MDSVDRAQVTHTHSVSSTQDVLLDGLLTGILGALAVAIWFFVLDVVQGRPFYTPALLGTVFLHGSAVASNSPVIAPLEIVAYSAVHFLAFAIVGLLFAWLMSMFERFPIAGFVLLVLLLCLQIGFFVLNAALGSELMGRLPMWSVIVANLLAAAAMAGYQWRRHPGVLARANRLWDDAN